MPPDSEAWPPVPACTLVGLAAGAAGAAGGAAGSALALVAAGALVEAGLAAGLASFAASLAASAFMSAISSSESLLGLSRSRVGAGWAASGPPGAAWSIHRTTSPLL
ncbi:MAG TPA: hypothetical protein VHU88_05680 [Sporichthyaceae bacterium]|nr:hypothetical protein [Sporichthyaceae bacterium]